MSTRGSRSLRGHHADDGVRLAPQDDRSPDGGRIGGEDAQPDPVAEDYRQMGRMRFGS